MHGTGGRGRGSVHDPLRAVIGGRTGGYPLLAIAGQSLSLRESAALTRPQHSIPDWDSISLEWYGLVVKRSAMGSRSGFSTTHSQLSPAKYENRFLRVNTRM